LKSFENLFLYRLFADDLGNIWVCSSIDALREGRNRVRSIALIRQNLYQFEDLNTVQLKRFVNDLCQQVETVFQKKNAVNVRIAVPDIHLDIIMGLLDLS